MTGLSMGTSLTCARCGALVYDHVDGRRTDPDGTEHRCESTGAAAVATHVSKSQGANSREAISSVPGVLMSDVEAERVQWVWRNWVALGKLTLVDGDPGVNKTTLALDVAGRVSNGSLMPDSAPGVDGGVVIVTGEDGLADTIRPRLEAAGADLTRIRAIQTAGESDDERPLSLPEDLPVIEQAIVNVGAKLVIIDPLMAFLSGRVDSHRDQDVRRALVQLASLANRCAVAVIVIRHLNKTQGARAIYRGGAPSGSSVPSGRR